MPGRRGPRGNAGPSASRPSDAVEDMVARLDVQRRPALRELRGDDLTVLNAAIRAELQLGAHIGDRKSDATDAGQQLAVTALPRFDRRVLALGLEVPELPLEDRCDARWVIDHLDIAGQLHRGVVRGRHAVLVLVPVPGDERVRAEHRKQRARPLRERIPDRIRTREVQHDLLVAVPQEVRRHDDRQIAAGAGRDQLSEVMFLEERAPLRVVEWRVVTVDEHASMMADMHRRGARDQGRWRSWRMRRTRWMRPPSLGMMLIEPSG